VNRDDFLADEALIEHLRSLNASSLGDPLGASRRLEDYRARRAALRAERRREALLTTVALVAVFLFTAFLTTACLDVNLAIAALTAVARPFVAVWTDLEAALRWLASIPGRL
jgi:hypothetical protein